MSLIMFYGEECPHCEKMRTLVAKLEAEENVKVELVEVWHNEEHMKQLESYDKEGECGGVPYFVNTDTDATICGEATHSELTAWSRPK
jgi:glutaredoxin